MIQCFKISFHSNLYLSTLCKELKDEPISPKKDNILVNNSLKQNSMSTANNNPSKSDKKNNSKQENCEAEHQSGHNLANFISTSQQQPKSPLQPEGSSLNKLLMVSSSKDPMMSSSISSPSKSSVRNNDNGDVCQNDSAQQQSITVSSFAKWINRNLCFFFFFY